MCAIPSPFRGTGTHPTGKGADEVSHFILIKNDLIKDLKGSRNHLSDVKIKNRFPFLRKIFLIKLFIGEQGRRQSGKATASHCEERFCDEAIYN